MNAPLRSKDLCAEPSRALPVEGGEERFAVFGMTDEAHKLLTVDYEGDLPSFLHDCTMCCDSCQRRYFAGMACREVELDDFGQFICEPCERRLDSLKAGSIWDDARTDALSGRGA